MVLLSSTCSICRTLSTTLPICSFNAAMATASGSSDEPIILQAPPPPKPEGRWLVVQKGDGMEIGEEVTPHQQHVLGNRALVKGASGNGVLCEFVENKDLKRWLYLHGGHEPKAIYCRECKTYLSSLKQWEHHRESKKHWMKVWEYHLPALRHTCSAARAVHTSGASWEPSLRAASWNPEEMD